MTLSEFKDQLKTKETIGFQLPDGKLVPGHFHVTEVGQIEKRFIDCGGTMRNERMVNFQLWEADDYDHRLHPDKLIAIIELSEQKLGLTNDEIEVEYQADTIGKFGMGYDAASGNFLLTTKQTDCLAKDNCGVPEVKEEKKKISLSMLNVIDSDNEGVCTPGGGCC